MISPKRTSSLLLISNNDICNYIYSLLEEAHHTPMVVSAPSDVLQYLKGKHHGIVFLDCESAIKFGLGIFSKFKVACPSCRLILICNKAHKEHREIIREAVDIGFYACLLAPYEDWEVLTMVRFYR